MFLLIDKNIMDLIFMMLLSDRSPRQFVGDFLFQDTGCYLKIKASENKYSLDVRVPLLIYGCGLPFGVTVEKVVEDIEEVISHVMDERVIKKLSHEKEKISLL